MDDINTICHNDFGIAFQWKRSAAKDFNKIQLVFKNTGLFLTPDELVQFSKNMESTCCEASAQVNDIDYASNKLYLLKGPNPQISFALKAMELQAFKDLINGTLFQLGLHKFLASQQVRFN